MSKSKRKFRVGQFVPFNQNVAYTITQVFWDKNELGHKMWCYKLSDGAYFFEDELRPLTALERGRQ